MKCVNSFEIVLYYCIWTFMILWSMYKLYETQTDIFSKDPFLRFSLSDLSTGWGFLGREKDVSDIEWSCWKYHIQISWRYFIFQFLVSEILRRFIPSTIKYWYIMSSIFYTFLYNGFIHLLMILIQPIIFFAVLICGGKTISTWVTSLLLLLCYNSMKYTQHFWEIMEIENSQEEKVFVLLFALAWIELKCISYCLDFIEKQEKIVATGEKIQNKNLLDTFTDMFSYVLYLPVLHLGPIILYEDFENSFKQETEKLWPRLKCFAVDIFLFTTYSFLLEFAFHFMYFHAMQNNMELIKQLPAIALAGGGLWMGFEFHTKYVISYGTTSAFARLDNIEAPPTPRCIARIHIYSNMWRYFDVGLYKFLLKYIYKPSYVTLCKYMNLSKLVYKVLASLGTFSFIFLWHGVTMNILIWSVLNFIGILLEQTARAISTTEWYKSFKSTILKTEAMEVRFIASLCSPLLAASAISNFYLFGGEEVGHLYIGLLNWPAPHNLLLVLLSTYCCSHVSMSLLDVPSRTDRKKPKDKVY